MRTLVIGALVCGWFDLSAADESVPAPRHGSSLFCEFEVFAVADHRPMVGIPYKVTLPGGHIRRGRVPASGIIHYPTRSEGNCTLDLDLPPGYSIAD